MFSRENKCCFGIEEGVCCTIYVLNLLFFRDSRFFVSENLGFSNIFHTTLPLLPRFLEKMVTFYMWFLTNIKSALSCRKNTWIASIVPQNHRRKLVKKNIESLTKKDENVLKRVTKMLFFKKKSPFPPILGQIRGGW